MAARRRRVKAGAPNDYWKHDHRRAVLAAMRRRRRAAIARSIAAPAATLAFLIGVNVLFGDRVALWAAVAVLTAAVLALVANREGSP